MIAFTRRTGAAVFASAIILVLVLGGGAVGVAELRGKWRDLAAKEAQLAALERTGRARRGGAFGATLASPFVEGGTFSLAANALQRRLVGLIEENGGTLRVASIEPPAAEGAADHRAVAQAAAEMTIEGLQHLLYRLESEAPVIFVESLTVERRGAPEAGTDGERTLRVELRVAGYFHAPAH